MLILIKEKRYILGTDSVPTTYYLSVTDSVPTTYYLSVTDPVSTRWCFIFLITAIHRGHWAKFTMKFIPSSIILPIYYNTL
jgi:hypothetical protein